MRGREFPNCFPDSLVRESESFRNGCGGCVMFKEGFVEFTSGEIRIRRYVAVFFSIERDMEDGRSYVFREDKSNHLRIPGEVWHYEI